MGIHGDDRTSCRAREARARAWRVGGAALLAAWVGALAPPARAERALVQPGLRVGGLEKSDLLLGELGCLGCHAAPDRVRARVGHKRAPYLGEVGDRATPGWLRAFLRSPQGTKPGTSMPEVLHGLPESEKEEVVEDLVHWLSSMRSETPEPGVLGDAYQVELGRRLYHTVGCVACHEPDDPPPEFSVQAGSPEAALRELRRQQAAGRDTESIPHGYLARKTTVPQLAKFLLDPGSVRPGGRMPSLRLTPIEAKAIAMYLLRAQLREADERPPQRVAGLRFEYFEGSYGQIADFDGAEAKRTGSVETFDLSNRDRNDQFAFRFSGLLRVDTAGTYRFFTRSDDGSDLWIGDQRVVDNDKVHGPTEKSGTIRLEAGEHPIRVSFFEQGGGEELSVHWEGPGILKSPIPPDRLLHYGRAMEPLESREIRVDLRRAERGREHFSRLGCAGCHDLGRGEEPPTVAGAPALASWTAASASRGCLASSPPRAAPRFQLSADVADALRRLVRGSLEELEEALEPGERIHREMALRNCYACHQRDQRGGPSFRRSEYFTPTVESDMGDEGRLAPRLDGVGDKLRDSWLRRVLVDGGVARPYVATRMPQFGEAHVGWLVEAFASVDRPPEGPFPAASRELDAAGRELVGNKGFGCITCHSYGSYASLGIPSVDLTQVTRRIRRDWFRRYVLSPQTYKPGTRMPEFWPEGQSVRPSILDGDTERQIAAIWHYLSRGQSAKIPHGLTRQGVELVPEDEALIYRHFIEGAGPRAIAVGYPEEAHLAFDANQQRLALVWRGRFLDATQHRSGRGTGFIAPMGEDVVRLVEGAPFAPLSTPDEPWPQAAGKEAGYRMGGYRLDALRRPEFLYSFDGVSVRDRPLALLRDGEQSIRRELRLSSAEPPERLWFRAAAASKVERRSDGSLRIDDRYTLRFESPSEATPFVRSSQGRTEVLILVRFQGGEAELIQEISW